MLEQEKIIRLEVAGEEVVVMKRIMIRVAVVAGQLYNEMSRDRLLAVDCAMLSVSDIPTPSHSSH